MYTKHKPPEDYLGVSMIAQQTIGIDNLMKNPHRDLYRNY